MTRDSFWKKYCVTGIPVAHGCQGSRPLGLRRSMRVRRSLLGVVVVWTFIGSVAASASDGEALIQAASEGDLSLVTTLLSQGADVHAKNVRDETALIKAAYSGHIEIVTLLIAQGADVNASDDHRWTALMSAVTYGSIEITKLLIAKNVDVDALYWGHDGHRTVLMLAAEHGQTEIADLLIAQDAKINAKNDDGWTSLMLAAKNGYSETVKFLIAQGADVNAKSTTGLTASIIAVENGHDKLSKILKPAGAVDTELSDMKALLNYYESILPEANVDPGHASSLLMAAYNFRSLSALFEKPLLAKERLVHFLFKLMLDASFADTIVRALEEMPKYSLRARELSEAANAYREVYDAAETVRYHIDFSADEKVELMRKLDVLGKERRIRRTLRRILYDMGYLDPDVNIEWMGLSDALKEYIKGLTETVVKEFYKDIDLISGMRGVLVPTIVEALEEEGLETLAPKISEFENREKYINALREGLWPLFTIQSEYDAQDLLSHPDLVAYLDAIIEYDREIIRLHGLSEVKNNKDVIDNLVYLFSVRESLRRRIILLEEGRRTFAAHLLYEIAEMGVRGDGFARTDQSSYLILSAASMALHLDASLSDASTLRDKIEEKLRSTENDAFAAKEYIHAGYRYAISGGYIKARELFSEGRQMYPYDENLYEWLVAMTYCNHGWDAAFRVWREENTDYEEREKLRLNYHLQRYLNYLGEEAIKEQIQYPALKHYSVLFGLVHGGMRGYSQEAREILDTIVKVYQNSPLKPKPSTLAVRYAVQAQQHIEREAWDDAEYAYLEAMAIAPWWPDAHYNLALLWYAELGALPGAVREMDLYLQLVPQGEKSDEAQKKRARWQRVIDEYVSHGASVDSVVPFLLHPDIQGW